MPSPRQPFADNESPPPQPVAAFATQQLRGEVVPVPGFGYNSWVFMGSDAVVKFDPIIGRQDNFACDSVADGLDLAGVATPKILAAGEIEGHEWIEISRIAGEPAYLSWLDYQPDVQNRFTQRLREALAEWRQIVPANGLVKTASEALFTPESAREQLAAASPFMPEKDVAAADALLGEREALETARHEDAFVLVHGDMWLGNMIASETGELVGLVDFGRAALAPADAELDTLLRFWKTPWLFVPEEWESRYRDGLNLQLLSGIIGDCTAGLSADEAAHRLAAYDLAYRLEKIADFGWSDEQERLLSAALDLGAYTQLIESR